MSVLCGGLCVGTLATNREDGSAIEVYVAGKVGGEVIGKRQNPFDIRCPTQLIEVKSAYRLTLNKSKSRLTKKGKHMYRSGRFLVCVGSHRRFLEKANAEGKSAIYYFVLKDWDTSSNSRVPVREKSLTWVEVDQLVSDKRRFRRCDNVEFVVLPLAVIFSDMVKRQRKQRGV